MNIAILRNMYAIRVRNLNCCHVYKQAMHQPWSTVDVTPDSQFVKELLRVRNNEIYLCDVTINEISALIECVCVTWCNYDLIIMGTQCTKKEYTHTQYAAAQQNSSIKQPHPPLLLSLLLS